METYKITRFKREGKNRTIKTGLTLEEAQKHCSREDTHKLDENGDPVWFDGFTKE